MRSPASDRRAISGGLASSIKQGLFSRRQDLTREYFNRNSSAHANIVRKLVILNVRSHGAARRIESVLRHIGECCPVGDILPIKVLLFLIEMDVHRIG